MRTQQLIDAAMEHLRTSASVKTVYGDPVVVDGKTVIPVAKVAEGKALADGAGVVGGKAKPVGVVEVSGTETKFLPIGQAKRLTIAGLVGSGIGVVLGLFLGRKVSRN
jgi:uncharacterized spore protein YtfJ